MVNNFSLQQTHDGASIDRSNCNYLPPPIDPYPEAELLLEEVGDEEVVGVHLDPVPARVGDHDGGDAPDDGVVVGRHVDAEQLVEGGHRVVLVDALGRAAVADVVLGARRHVALPGDEGRAPAAARRDLALQPGDDGRHLLHQLGVLAEALVAPAPPRVSAHLHTDSFDSSFEFGIRFM